MGLFQQQDWRSNSAWIPPLVAVPPAPSNSNATTGITPNPQPSGTVAPGNNLVGGGPNHISVNGTQSGAVYQVPHGLPYTPTAVWMIRRTPEGTTPTSFYTIVSINSQTINFRVSNTTVVTWEIFYI